jgi:integrase
LKVVDRVTAFRHIAASTAAAKPNGLPYQPRSFTHAFAREIARIRDLKRIGFHDLRHTHATQLLEAKVHLKVVQERLGHSTIATTLDIYSHVTASMQEDAASRLDAALGRAISGAPSGT